MPYDAMPSISGYVRAEVFDVATGNLLSKTNKYASFNISQNNSGNNVNRNSGSNNSNNNNQNNDPQIKVPVTVYCAFCAGSKICPDCAGQRTRYLGRDKIICTSCSGTGICNMCHGTGISMVVYQ
jgi:Pyruvate/2-oxoacid:ferredoxin oxidoreductase delta subunit